MNSKEAANFLGVRKLVFHDTIRRANIRKIRIHKGYEYNDSDLVEFKKIRESKIARRLEIKQANFDKANIVYPIVMPVMRLTDNSQKIMCKVCYHSGLRLTERNICISCTHKSWNGSKAINAVRSA